MGLFRKKAAAGIESPKDFYITCIGNFNATAQRYQQAMRDTIFIPELIDFGTQAILWFYKNDELQRQISEPAEYYYVAVCTALHCGILFACQWHENYKAMCNNGFVNKIMETGPSRFTPGIIKKTLGWDDIQFRKFVMAIFEKWMELHKPYWNLKDPREYTFQATLAVYQLGISMTLGKLGY